MEYEEVIKKSEEIQEFLEDLMNINENKEIEFKSAKERKLSNKYLINL